MNKLTLISLLLLVSSFVWAGSDGEESVETVVLTEAGTLREKVSELETLKIVNIKISGPINGADIEYLRSGVGRISNLQTIDLRDVVLTPDETVYAKRSKHLDVGFGNAIHNYILSNENKVEQTSTSGNLGNGNLIFTHYNNGLAGAFMEMENLTKVVLPANISHIGEYAFNKCKNLTEVDFGSSVEGVGDYAFNYCVNLTTIGSTSSATYIGEFAFSCTKITKADLGKVREMGQFAFEYADLIGSIDLSSLRKIPDCAFYECEGITKVTFSNSLDSILDLAFYKTSTTEAIIPEGCKYIGGAFGNTKLKKVSIPESLIDLSYGAFGETPWWEDLCNSQSGSPVIYLGNIAMDWRENITELSFREGTTAIANRAEYNISSPFKTAKKIVFPSSLRRIGNFAFSEFTKLEEVVWPENLEEIGQGAFMKCPLLSSANLGSKMRFIGQRAFKDCVGIQEVKLSSSIEVIEEVAFAECIGLIRVQYDVPDAKGWDIFRGCQGLEKVTFGSSVRRIPTCAFLWCSSLSNADFKSIVNPDSFNFDGACFAGCSNLKKVEFPANIDSIGDGAFMKTGLSEIYLTKGARGIGEGAFGECPNLTTALLPANIEYLNNKAFLESPITAFYCYSSEPIRFSGKGDFAKYHSKSATVYVTSKEIAYRFDADPVWTKFLITLMDEEHLQLSVSTPLVDSSNDATFNLQGLRVGYDYKGIVIQNGKKLIKK